MHSISAKRVHGTTTCGAKFGTSARLTLVAALALVAIPATAAAQSVPATHVERTAHYTLDLTVGSAETMISPLDASKAQTGEIMVGGGSMMGTGPGMMPGVAMGAQPGMMPTGGMSQPSGGTAPMAMGMATPGVDQGMAVNHHVEVHITQNALGSVVNNVTPAFRITDKSTGQSRDLPQVMAMYGVQAGLSDFHYGQNVYLPDGVYEITVMIGSDTAEFRDLMVSGGAPMMPNTPLGPSPMTPSGSMSGMGSDAVARDGRRLADQASGVQSLFNSVWKDRAAQEWAMEHNASLTMP